MNPTLPHRYRESSFREYELWIATILRNMPRVTRIDHTSFNKSPETFICRLRDAMHSLAKYKWPSRISQTDAQVYIPTIVCSQRENHILVGTREAIRNLEKTEASVKVERAGDAKPYDFTKTILGETVDMDDFEGIRVICRLAQDAVLNRPIKLRLRDSARADFLVSKFDIDLEPVPDEPNTYILT